jgi:hypothetical protein
MKLQVDRLIRGPVGRTNKSTNNDELRTAAPYVVTRSRPYPARRSREVEAVGGWVHERDSGCDVIASLPDEIPATWHPGPPPATWD